MGKIITKLPEEINPIILIEEKQLICPYCGHDCSKDKIYHKNVTEQMDKNGKYHKILKSKNKYIWKRYPKIYCPNCKCEYDTKWFPYDNEMFEIEIKDEKDWNKYFEEYAKI